MIDNGLHNEKVLIKKLNDDDYASFDKLFAIYGHRIYSFAFGFLKSKLLAEDIVQQCFLLIWENRKNIQYEKSFKGYVFTISYHLILKELKNRSKYLSTSDLAQEELLPADSDTLEKIDYHFTKNYIQELIDQLPERQREVFMKSRNEGLSHKEISEQLNISTKTVENHITKAIAFIKKSIPRNHLHALLYVALFFTN